MKPNGPLDKLLRQQHRLSTVISDSPYFNHICSSQHLYSGLLTRPVLRTHYHLPRTHNTRRYHNRHLVRCHPRNTSLCQSKTSRPLVGYILGGMPLTYICQPQTFATPQFSLQSYHRRLLWLLCAVALSVAAFSTAIRYARS